MIGCVSFYSDEVEKYMFQLSTSVEVRAGLRTSKIGTSIRLQNQVYAVLFVIKVSYKYKAF